MAAETCVCECCGFKFQVETTHWGEASALAEMAREFPGLSAAAAATVCEQCYEKIMRAVKS